MSTTVPNPQPSPLLFFQTINAYQRTEALNSAIELDLFTAIAEGNVTAAAIAQRCKAAERGVRILCDYLVTIGFLTKQQSNYGLTVDTAMFLSRSSPAYLGGAVGFLNSPLFREDFTRLTEAVRKGGCAAGEGTTLPENPIWVDFARSMAALMFMPAEQMARLLKAGAGEKWKVLDIAAGHGVFGVALARYNPNAEVVAVDWPNVLQVAQENAEKAGVAARFSTKPGSAFDVDFGSGYDLVLLTNFLHHFDPPTNEKLLKKVHAALKPGGRAVTLEFVPNPDRVTPPEAAGFSLIMLSGTPAGDAYTFAELESMFRNAGFSASELHPLPPTMEQVVISRK